MLVSCMEASWLLKANSSAFRASTSAEPAAVPLLVLLALVVSLGCTGTARRRTPRLGRGLLVPGWAPRVCIWVIALYAKLMHSDPGVLAAEVHNALVREEGHQLALRPCSPTGARVRALCSGSKPTL